MGVSAQNSVLVREPAQGGEQGIELAGGQQFIEPAETVEHPLTDLAVDTLVLDHDEVGAIVIGLRADEHGACVSLTIVGQYCVYYKLTIEVMAKYVTLHFWRPSVAS